MNALVGYTGFVGSNICMHGKIDYLFNSKNISKAYGLRPDLLIYAGLRAEKYLANHVPEKDMDLIIEAEDNIRRIEPKKLVLISTIDVFKNPVEVDENSEIDCLNLQPYGFNRYQLECWVRENFEDALIIRLPGLFGVNLKKNFIYDFINPIPNMLNFKKMEELLANESELKKFYKLQDNGFYKCKELTQNEHEMLHRKFDALGFSALNFTDSRSTYQFYPLKRLWEDIQIALENDIRLWHPATEPVSISELHMYLTGKEFRNILDGPPVNYDCKTRYANIFDGVHGRYIADKKQIMEAIAQFVKSCNIA